MAWPDGYGQRIASWGECDLQKPLLSVNCGFPVSLRVLVARETTLTWWGSLVRVQSRLPNKPLQVFDLQGFFVYSGVRSFSAHEAAMP
jgi:hypothetical protein